MPITPRAYYCLESFPAPSHIILTPSATLSHSYEWWNLEEYKETSNATKFCLRHHHNFIQCVHNRSDYSPPRHDFICAVITSPKRYLNFIRFVLHLICKGRVVSSGWGAVIALSLFRCPRVFHLLYKRFKFE